MFKEGNSVLFYNQEQLTEAVIVGIHKYKYMSYENTTKFSDKPLIALYILLPNGNHILKNNNQVEIIKR